MINVLKRYKLTCDKCQHEEYLDAENIDLAKKFAEEKGWKISDDKFYCNSCKGK